MNVYMKPALTAYHSMSSWIGTEHHPYCSCTCIYHLPFIFVRHKVFQQSSYIFLKPIDPSEIKGFTVQTIYDPRVTNPWWQGFFPQIKALIKRKYKLLPLQLPHTQSRSMDQIHCFYSYFTPFSSSFFPFFTLCLFYKVMPRSSTRLSFANTSPRGITKFGDGRKEIWYIGF